MKVIECKKQELFAILCRKRKTVIPFYFFEMEVKK